MKFECYAKTPCLDPQSCSMHGSCQGAESTAPEPTPGLTLFPSPHYHGAAGILLDREGLAMLRGLLDEAERSLGSSSEGHVVAKGQAFDTKGEGHDFSVVLLGDQAFCVVGVEPPYPDQEWGGKMDITDVLRALGDG